MGKIAKKLASLQKHKVANGNEGLLKFEFTFNGERVTHTHRLSESEIAGIKDITRRNGMAGVHSVVVKMAIKCAGVLGENMIAKAVLAFMKKEGIPDEGLAPKQEDATVFDHAKVNANEAH